MKKAIKILSIVLAVVIGYFAVTVSIYMPFVVKDAKTFYNDSCEYLIVLGNQVVSKDTPSSLMLDRVERAAEYARENEKCRVVVCGGITTDEQIISEAALMKKLLSEKGIESDRIILEDKSTTTFENFEFAKIVIEENTGENIADVDVAFLSSDYHIHRASVIADHFGFKNIGKVTAVSTEGLFKSLVREYFVGYDLLIRLVTD